MKDLDVKLLSIIFLLLKSLPYYIFQIKCKHVVLAAGAWSKMLAERIGVTIPLKVIKHNYLVTEIIPGVSNLPNVRYYDGGIYLKV